MDEIVEIISGHPEFGNILMLMGGLRLVFKPIFSCIESYIASTPQTTDDERWASLKNSKGMKTFMWFMDFFASVKMPKTTTTKINDGG